MWRLFVTPVILGGLLGYQPIIMKNGQKKVVPLFHFDHLPNSIAKIFAFCTWFRTCNNMKTLVWGFGCNIAACLKKSPENVNFCFKSVQKIDLFKIKSNFFSSKFLVFLRHDMTRCALYSFGKSNNNSSKLPSYIGTYKFKCDLNFFPSLYFSNDFKLNIYLGIAPKYSWYPNG